MSLPIIIRDAAQAELDGAVDWYERQGAGLGTDFAIAVERVLTRIADQPDFYPFARNDVREGIVHGFPYCVFYREKSGQISVVAVFHTARNPVIWQRRS